MFSQKYKCHEKCMSESYINDARWNTEIDTVYYIVQGRDMRIIYKLVDHRSADKACNIASISRALT